MYIHFTDYILNLFLAIRGSFKSMLITYMARYIVSVKRYGTYSMMATTD